MSRAQARVGSQSGWRPPPRGNRPEDHPIGTDRSRSGSRDRSWSLLATFPAPIGGCDVDTLLIAWCRCNTSASQIRDAHGAAHDRG